MSKNKPSSSAKEQRPTNDPLAQFCPMEQVRVTHPSTEKLKSLKASIKISKLDFKDALKKCPNDKAKLRYAFLSSLSKLENHYQRVLLRINQTKPSPQSKPSQHISIWHYTEGHSRPLKDFTKQELTFLKESAKHSLNTIKSLMVLTERHKNNPTILNLCYTTLLMEKNLFLIQKTGNIEAQKDKMRKYKTFYSWLIKTLNTLSIDTSKLSEPEKSKVKKKQENFKKFWNAEKTYSIKDPRTGKTKTVTQPRLLIYRQHCADISERGRATKTVEKAFNNFYKEIQTTNEFNRVMKLPETGNLNKALPEITRYAHDRITHAINLLKIQRSPEKRESIIGQLDFDAVQLLMYTPKYYKTYQAATETLLRTEARRILSDKSLFRRLQELAGKVSGGAGSWFLNRFMPGWENSDSKFKKGVKAVANEINDIINNPKGRQAKIETLIVKLWRLNAEQHLKNSTKLTARDAEVIKDYRRTLQKAKEFKGRILPKKIQTELDRDTASFLAVKQKFLSSNTHLARIGRSLDLYGTTNRSKPTSTFAPETAKSISPALTHAFNPLLKIAGWIRIPGVLDPGKAYAKTHIVPTRSGQSFTPMIRQKIGPKEIYKPLIGYSPIGWLTYMAAKIGDVGRHDAEFAANSGGGLGLLAGAALNVRAYKAYKKATKEFLKQGLKKATAKAAAREVAKFGGLRIAGRFILSPVLGTAISVLGMKGCGAMEKDIGKEIADISKAKEAILKSLGITKNMPRKKVQEKMAKATAKQVKNLRELIFHEKLLQVEASFGHGTYSEQDLKNLGLSKEMVFSINETKGQLHRFSAGYNAVEFKKALYEAIIAANSEIAYYADPRMDYFDTSSLSEDQQAKGMEKYGIYTSPKRKAEIEKRESAMSKVIRLIDKTGILKMVDAKGNLTPFYKKQITAAEKTLATVDKKGFKRFVKVLVYNAYHAAKQLSNISRVTGELNNELYNSTHRSLWSPSTWFKNQGRSSARRLNAELNTTSSGSTLKVDGYGKTTKLRVEFNDQIRSTLLRKQSERKLKIASFFHGQNEIPTKNPRKAILIVNLKHYLKNTYGPSAQFKFDGQEIRKVGSSKTVVSAGTIERFLEPENTEDNRQLLLNFLNDAKPTTPFTKKTTKKTTKKRRR